MNRQSVLVFTMALALVASVVAVGGVTAQEVDAEAEADRLEEEADRLELELYAHVTWEISNQSVDRVGIDIIDALDESVPETPEEARALGDRLWEDLGHLNPDIKDAQEALHSAADGAEEFQASLGEAAADLRATEDPVAEAERIDEEVILQINTQIDEGANAEFEYVDPVEGIAYILEDPTAAVDDDIDEVTGDDDDADEEPADDDADEDGMAAGFVVVTAIGAILAVSAALRVRAT